MSTSYTLRFTDPAKASTTISVPSGTRNNYDTSLDLVGPGYVNYGQSIAQDFLKLLENFASPNPPENPIEGQLWYDTSNPSRKVLRVNNGAATSARWPSANGIYQQATDPSTQYQQNLIDGDVWVDTGNTQLKIRYGDEWTLVGPSVSTGDAKTGSESVTIVSNTGDSYPIIQNWVNGRIVEIIAYDSFTPRTVIDGFPSLSAGLNLTNRVSAKFNGVADRAKSLEVSTGVTIAASNVLEKAPATRRQTHVGTFIIESAAGLIVKRSGGYELQINTTGTNGVISYGNSSGSLKVGVGDNSYIKFNGTYGTVGINTSTVTSGLALAVNGSATFKNNVTIISSAATSTGLTLTGSADVAGTLNVSGNLNVTGITTLTNTITVTDILPTVGAHSTLGSASNPFERIYTDSIGTTSTYFAGRSEIATRLETARAFRVSGHTTSSAVTFAGTASVVLSTVATRDMIASPTGGTTSTTTATQTLLILNTATSDTELQSISKSDFLADVYPSLISTGMIISYVSPGPFTGWLYCDGSQHTASNYTSLYSIIGDKYTTGTTYTPGFFRVPNLTTATVSGTNGHPLYYHIKT
jgi:hypothetical protein